MHDTALPLIPTITSVTDLRYKTKKIMESLQEEGKTVLLTRASDPIAVLLPIGLYESIRQYIEYLEDERDLRSMKAVLARKETTSDFSVFDKAMRKKFGASDYVQHRSSK